MTIYKLKKDWSAFKAGEKFKLAAYNDGDLYQLIDGSDNYVLAKIPTDLLNEVDNGGYWKPKARERYYFIDDGGAIDSEAFDPDMIYDNDRLLVGNCFRIKEDARAMVAWIKARQSLIESGARFINTIDVDSSQSYYAIYYTIDRGGLVIEDAYIGENTVGDKRLYFDDRQLADKSIKEHRDDWLTYLGVKEKSDDNS